MKGQHKVIIQTIIFIVFSLCTLATVNALFDPGLPTNPDPSDDAITVPVDQDLSWTNGADTETIDLYFADDEWLVTDKDLSVLVLDNIFVDTYDPGILDLGTEYYWRVVSHNSSKATTDGPVWSFTTTDQYMLIVTKGIDTHINDVELSWLPGNLISVFYKQSPNVVVGYQLLDQDVTPSSWHPAALIDGIDYYYMVSNDEAPIIDLIT
ncbi:hypothetical protein JXQ70_05070, partial [bacterium]|nr:hypothetical protein [bacterium]